MHVVTDDQSKWRGVVGVIPGEFILKFSGVQSGSTTLYTVPTGRVLYIVHAHVNIGGGGTGEGYITILNSTGATYYVLADTGTPNTTGGPSGTFSPAIPLPLIPGYHISIGQGSGTGYAYGGFYGYIV